MTEVWLAREHHGYQYVFSTRAKAEAWLQKELDKSAAVYELWEEFNDERHHAVYLDSELLGSIERYIVDDTR